MASTDTRTEQDRRAALIAARRRHWHRTRRMTGVMLALWLLATLVPLFYARELAQLTLFGWPLSFYLAAQGASLVYLAIVGTYYWRMGRIDARFRRELA
ncbi:MAG TPA: sodium/substrate symporter small subunit [Telluria sp.]|nr:sodium/substrate symporter small subunit [Telluria sp.]